MPESIESNAGTLESNRFYRERRRAEQKVSSPGEQMEEVTREFINNLGRIADFFGFSRLMGQLYAVLFLSPEPLTLEDMGTKLDSSKGNVSINIRVLERWGLVRQIYKWADRKNYYEAETDIWKAISGILQERERKESQQMLDSLTQSMQKLEDLSRNASTNEISEAQFYMERMEQIRKLFQFSDTLLEMMVRGGAVDFSRASQLARDLEQSTRQKAATAEVESFEEVDEN